MRLMIIGAILAMAINCDAQLPSGKGANGGSGRNRQEDKPMSVFNTKTPERDYDLLVNSITENSAGVSVLLKNDGEAYIEYNGRKSTVYILKSGYPVNIRLDYDKSDSLIRYRLFYKPGSGGADSFLVSDEYEFTTAVDDGDSFQFTVTADSHLDENCDVGIYEKTMMRINGCNPAFHIDLGDTFMVDKYRDDYKKSEDQYLAQRYYFGIIGKEAPVYLVHGNHDGENAESKGGMREWAAGMRRLYFPSLNEKNYYSIGMGNLEIFVLDPFGYTTRSGMHDPWMRTLGKEQYEWLVEALSKSSARHKIVMIHNLVGGVDIKGKFRGGAEAALFYEWGGYSQAGEYEFDRRRQGWELPIHDLLKKHGVSIVVRGHDHVYANQEHDGIIYLCLPQPGMKNRPGNLQYAHEYGYESGILHNNPGFVRFTVKDEVLSFDYIDTEGNLR